LQQRAVQHYQSASTSTSFDALLDDSVFANVAPMLSVERVASVLHLPAQLITAYINNGSIRGVISQPGLGTFISRPSIQLFWRQLCLGEFGAVDSIAEIVSQQMPVEAPPIAVVSQHSEEQLAFVFDTATPPANDPCVIKESNGGVSAITVAPEYGAKLQPQPQPQPEPELEPEPQSQPQPQLEPEFKQATVFAINPVKDKQVPATTDITKQRDTTPDYVNDIPALVNFLETTDFKRTQRVPGVKYLDVRKNKNSVVLSVSVKMNKTNAGRDLVSLPLNQPIDHGKVEEAMAVFKSFLQQFAAKTPWGMISWSVDAKPKLRRVITTAAELIGFYLEHSDFADTTRNKVNRIFKRYFSGTEGQIDLSTIKRCDYVKAILEMPHAERTKSDYNELIKYTSAAYNFAKHHKDLEKLNFDNPVEGLKRDRSKPKDAPKLSVYVRILSKAVELGLNDFALSLVFQEMSFCRKALTCHMPISMLDTVNWRFKVDVRNNKSKTTADHYIAPRFIPLLEARLGYLERKFGKDNKWLFPSSKIRGQHRANFDKDFDKAKNAVLADLELYSDKNVYFDERIAAVRSFTQHRLRALNEKLLQEINVYEAEKKNAFNHYMSDVNIAYGDLSNRRQREFKDEKFSSISERYADYTDAIDTLTKYYQGNP